MATAHNTDDFDKSSHWLWGRSSRSWHLLSSLLNRRCDTRFLKRSHCIVMSNIIIPFCYIFPLSLYSFSICMNEFFIIRVTADVATLIRFIYQRLFLRVYTFCIWSYNTVTLDSFISYIHTENKKIFLPLVCRPLGLKNQRVVRSHLIASRYRTTTTTTSRTSQLRAQENRTARQTTSQRIRA